MKKKTMCSLFLAAVMGTAVITGGCQENSSTAAVTKTAELEQFKGGGMTFSYDPANWRVSAAERMREGSVISVYNQDNHALAALVAYEEGDATQMDLFNEIRRMDEDANIMDEKTDRETTAGLKRYTLSYWVEDETAENGRRYVYAEVRRFKEKGMIAVLAEYYQEEALPGIQEVLNTVDISGANGTGDVLATLDKDRRLGTVLDEFLYYYNGEHEIVQNEVLAELDQTFHEKDDYEYICETELVSSRGNIHKVASPNADNYDGSYLYFYEHGLYFCIYIDDFFYRQSSVDEYMNKLIAEEVQYYKENSRDYKNVVEQPMVVNGDEAYQVVHVDVLGMDMEATTETTVHYVRKLNSEEVLYWSLELVPDSYDGETWPLVQELFRVYGVDEDAIEFEVPELTLGGLAIEQGQENYTADDDEEVIEPVEGYPLMGVGRVTEENVEAEIYVPRGKYTYNLGYSIDFNLYGVSGNAYLWENYLDQSTEEHALKMLEQTYENHQGYAKYYQDLSEIKTITDDAGTMSALVFSEYSVEADESRNLIYQIVICQAVEDDYMALTQIEIDTAYASAETMELLNQYGALLGIDFLELMETGADNLWGSEEL